MRHKQSMIRLVLMLLMLASPVWAQSLGVTTPEAKGLIAKAVRGLEALPPVKGRFAQNAPDGSVAKGVFYLWRPGRMRFEYDAPSPILVVADGYNVKVADNRLKTVDAYPIGATPLKVLLSKTIALDRDVLITRVVRTKDSVAITARDKKGQADGEITLVFDAAVTTLKQWTVTDATGAATRVQLLGYGRITPDPKLFQLRGDVKAGGRPSR